MTSPSNPYRLVRAVVPSAYRIFITPDLDAATFAGRVEIDVDVSEPLGEVTLNARNLNLGAATLTSAGTAHRSSEPTLEEKYETATFSFDETVHSGPATIEIAFMGVLNDRLLGFYRSTFVDAHGVTHTIATTQFENSDAREAFPCWDEPSFKATFQVNLTVPSELAAYSNTKVTSNTDLGNGQRTFSFAPTMKMSTYLVAFVVGPFEETEAVDVLGTPLRVVHIAGQSELTGLALEAGEFALRFFSDYFDIPYPGDKLDMIAIPDFAFGAMENLGCITYRETALLIDPMNASHAEKERVAAIVAHEIAHMWFGDLVTMEWWEGIWLNEAFATFMEVFCTDAFRPEWKMWVAFGIVRDVALQIDGLHTTRPIEYEVISPAETRGMIDPLTYEKGGGVLRMIEQYMGPTVFRDGIRLYLKRHSYANTVTTDLWDALEEVSGHPVRDVMDTFILQGGHPMVTLEGGFVRQEPFAYGPSRGRSPSAIGKSWLVPVLLRSLDGGDVQRLLLADSPAAITIARPVVLNAGGSGVFRSRYGTDELAALTPRMDELDDVERVTLVADSWAALFAGAISAADFYAVAKGLGAKDEPSPWLTIATAVDHIARGLDDAGRANLARYVRDLFTPQFTRLGWDPIEGEDELAAQLRATVLSTLGTTGGDEGIRAEALRRFERNTLDGNLAHGILRIVADQGRPGDYETFLDRYRASTNPQEKVRYLWGLGGFSDEAMALDAAQRCFSEFRSQDAPILMGILMRNPTTGPAIWHYVTGRWEEALEKWPPSVHTRIVGGVSTFYNDPVLADEVEAFHTRHPLTGEQRSVDQLLERMRVGMTFAVAMRAQF